jgi:hypothetical protein
MDVNYKRYLNKFNENKEKEAKKKKKEEEERLKNEPKPNQQPTIREISAEEAERIKNEQNKPKEDKMIVDDVKPTDVSIPEEKKEGEDDKGPKAGHVMPAPGNGNVFEKYSWNQLLIHEINVMIPVPSNIKGKDVIVEHDTKYLKVQIKGQDPIIDSELCKPMNVYIY